MKYLRIIISIMAAVIVFTGCRDDDGTTDVPQTGTWTVSLLGGSAVEVSDDGDAVFGHRAVYGSIRVEIKGYDAARDGNVIVECKDAEWLNIEGDTLGDDGIVSITTLDNDTERRRSATITFSSELYPSLSTSIVVDQLSTADEDNNGVDARSQLYVGYGYDIYKALDSPMAVRAKRPIIDYEMLVKAGNSASYETVHDSHLSRTEMKYVASKSLYEYAENLTRQQTKSEEYAVAGCKADCELAAGLGEGANRQMQNYGRGMLVKTVHARVIDKAALLHLRKIDQIPFSSDFLNSINAILTEKGDNRKKRVIQTLEEYGTHLIMQADLGGRIDYTFSIEKSGVVYAQDELVEEAEYTMGRISKKDRNQGYNQQTSSSKSAAGAIKVLGGSEQVRSILKQDISGLDKTAQLPPDHITEWLASINYNDNALQNGDIDVIHFELEPLWNLVPDELRDLFMEVTLNMTERSDCKVRDDILGTDLYNIDCTREDLFKFNENDDGQSLCRILYLRSGEENTMMPVLQVCSEYVPKIRTDRRVTVIYPIYKQKIRMNEGLFIGDGVHQPAYVGFGGGECYVAPLTAMKNSDIVKRVSYINGSLNVEISETKFISEDKRGRTVRDDIFYFRSSPNTFKYPIVKIGEHFWTRKDVSHKMGLATSASSDRTLDVVKEGVLYARFWHELGRTTVGANKWLWAYEPNTLFPGNPNTKWFFPTGEDIRRLHTFLGFNPKALFPGQASGFNAQFNGYWGTYDILNEVEESSMNMQYKGELNIFATRNTKNDSEARLVVLDKNYNLYEAATGANGPWRENYYPVRPVRGYMFNYPTLNTYQDFENKYK